MMSKSAGVTLLEMMVVLIIGSILTYYSHLNLKKFSNPAVHAVAILTSFIKETRQQALLSTRAYKITPISTTKVKTAYASSCSSLTFTDDTTLTLTLPSGSTLSSTTWSICYSPRGLSPSSVNISVYDSSLTKTLQVALGGAVRIL